MFIVFSLITIGSARPLRVAGTGCSGGEGGDVLAIAVTGEPIAQLHGVPRCNDERQR
ncbi:hypothetical protein D3C81_2138280 [compost metagenome]